MVEGPESSFNIEALKDKFESVKWKVENLKIGDKVRFRGDTSGNDLMFGKEYIVKGAFEDGFRLSNGLFYSYRPWEDQFELVEEDTPNQSTSTEGGITFDRYQERTARTDSTVSGDRKDQLLMTALGLAGEVGEYVEIIKKHVYHGKPLDPEIAVKELGDVMWYLSRAIEYAGFKMSEAAQKNLDKLNKRYEDGFSVKASEARVDVGGSEN